jgi:hypothetical protein
VLRRRCTPPLDRIIRSGHLSPSKAEPRFPDATVRESGLKLRITELGLVGFRDAFCTSSNRAGATVQDAPCCRGLVS